MLVCTRHGHTYRQQLATHELHYGFTDHNEDQEIFPKTIKEITEEQHKDKSLDALKTYDKYDVLLIENTKALYKYGKSLQKQVVQQYHHYLQHSGHTKKHDVLKSIGKVQELLSDHTSKVPILPNHQKAEVKVCVDLLAHTP